MYSLYVLHQIACFSFGWFVCLSGGIVQKPLNRLIQNLSPERIKPIWGWIPKRGRTLNYFSFSLTRQGKVFGFLGLRGICSTERHSSWSFIWIKSYKVSIYKVICHYWQLWSIWLNSESDSSLHCGLALEHERKCVLLCDVLWLLSCRNNSNVWWN